MAINKREFLRMLAAALGSGAAQRIGQGASPLAAQRNWAGNLTFAATHRTPLRDATAARAFVETHPSLKVLGSRHCFSDIADTAEQLVSLEGIRGITALDRTRSTVTVGGGTTYSELGPELDRRGYALHNLASLPDITVAGACATGTHGSGSDLGNLATAVVGLELVDGHGQLRSFSRDASADFDGMVVHLGALGVITQLTLNVQPRFDVHEYRYRNLSLDQACNNFSAIMASGYSVSLFTRWQDMSIRIKTRADASFAAPATLFGAERASDEPARGAWFERLPHFQIGDLPPQGNELQSEYFVSMDHAPAAIRAVAQHQAAVAPLLRATEIRTIAADELWMSPAYQRDSVAIHFTWKPEETGVRRVLPRIEQALAPYAPRPHWGKLHSIAAPQVQARYPRLDDFRQLARSLDPEGKFGNRFLKELLT